MLSQNFDLINYYIDYYLAKRFIQTSLTSFFFLVLFVNKLDRKIRFCVYYQKQNAILKKNCYLISLIEVTLA